MKRVVEAALSPVAALLSRRRIGTRETLVLAYHNIVPHGGVVAGEASLHLPQHVFAAQLDLVRATHDVIPLEGIRDRPHGRRPRAVITFDDGYRGAMTAGLEELERRRLPATFFIAPAFVPDGSFWWDVAAAGSGGIEAEFRRRAIEEYAGRDAGIRTAIEVSALRGALPRHARAVDAEELKAAAAVPGVTFGSHTWSHVNLARVSDDDAVKELTDTRRWLNAQLPNVIDWISFPYGRSSANCEQIARDCGYGGALRIDGGWVRSSQRGSFVLPRINVPSGLSVRGFRLRTAGLLES